MYKLFLSLKFFFSRKINIIAVIGIAGGVWLLIVVPSVMNGFVDQTRGYIRGTLSDLIITPLATKDRDGVIKDPSDPLEKYTAVLKKIPEIEGFAPRITWVAIIGSARLGNVLLANSDSQQLATTVVQIVGMDPEQESKISKLQEFLTNKPLYYEGDPVDNPKDPFAVPLSRIEESERPYAKKTVILPEGVFHNLGFKKGERIVLHTAHLPENNQNSDPTFKSISEKFYLAGSYRTGVEEVQGVRAFMKRSVAQDFIGTDREFTEIAVKIQDYQKAQEVKRKIRLGLEEADLACRVETWEEQKHTLLRAVNNETMILTIMLSAVILVAGINIFVILSLMVGFKTHDIGTIGALGGTRTGIMTIFMGVGFFTALFGELLGGTAGYLTVKYLTPFEYFLRDHFGIVLFDPKIYAFDHLPTIFSWSQFVMLLVVTMLACLLASFFPALRASRMKPVEALRYE